MVVQAPLTTGSPRTSQHCILAYTTRIVSCLLAELSVGTTWHFPCLSTRAVSWADQALPDLKLLMPGVAPAW